MYDNGELTCTHTHTNTHAKIKQSQFTLESFQNISTTASNNWGYQRIQGDKKCLFHSQQCFKIHAITIQPTSILQKNLVRTFQTRLQGPHFMWPMSLVTIQIASPYSRQRHYWNLPHNGVHQCTAVVWRLYLHLQTVLETVSFGTQTLVTCYKHDVY